jgi:uncharacterized protein (TIGR00299 family) protein
MRRLLWLNPVFGVSGDMLLGALFDAGASLERVRSGLQGLDIDGWHLEVEAVSRRGIRASHAVVKAPPTGHRPWSEIDELLASSDLLTGVREGARRTFRLLAEVEADAHGASIDEVQFHEVGALDAIVDIVGSWLALEELEVDEVRSAPIGLGAGRLSSAHGGLPHPGPAVISLLEGLPITGLDVEFETVTPTGAALLRSMVETWGVTPTGTLVGTGLGAGSIDSDSHANILTALIVEEGQSSAVTALLLETNVDDVAPEILAHVIDVTLEIGADDAWIVPVVMKKGRPAHQIRVLCPPGLSEELIQVLARETGTLGVRILEVSKRVFERSFGSVEVDGHPIAIKEGPYGAKPEFEDVLQVARETGRAVSDVSRAALAAWDQDSG